MYNDEIDDEMLEAVEDIKNEYQQFFKQKLEDWGIESPADLSYEDKKKFFDEIEKEWNPKNESTDDENLNEDFNDVYANIYDNIVCPKINQVGDIVTFPFDGYDTDFEIELITEPAKFGDSSTYYIKALNGPHEGEKMSFSQEYIQENVENSEIDDNDEIREEEITDMLDEIVGQVDDPEDNRDDNLIDEDDELEESDLDKLLGIKESTEFDVTDVNTDDLEDILKMFLDKKAEDGKDYSLDSEGKKLVLKVNNDKFVKDVKKILK